MNGVSQLSSDILTSLLIKNIQCRRTASLERRARAITISSPLRHYHFTSLPSIIRETRVCHYHFIAAAPLSPLRHHHFIAAAPPPRHFVARWPVSPE
jgi:hypothetical protein